ncbi:transcriptional regulator, PucR family [Actinobacteria bacterium OK074]|nr:transcriptional regulator, PucR family [Actinobacteria bacterium OK074]
MPVPSAVVPPTPPVPLTELVARTDLGLRQIAGPPMTDAATATDATTVIHWAHTSEMADPYPYLLGGELLLTAGVHVPEAAGDRTYTGPYFDTYVARIVEAGGAALGFGLAPVHEAVPPALVRACDAHGLPLLEVPPRTTFSAVARAVWQLMAEARHTELRRVTDAQRALAAAAAQPDPTPSVLRRLAQHVAGRAALYGPEGTEIATAGRPPAPEVASALAELTTVVRPTGRGPRPASATDTIGGTHLTAYALGTGQGYVLAVATPHRTPGDHTIASVAAVLLSLLTDDTTATPPTSALVRVLLGAPPETVAPLLGGGDQWWVVHATGDTTAAASLGTALGSPLLDVTDDVVRVLVREPPEAPLPGWTLGISAPASPPDWPTADRQAARALSRARATRTPLVRHGTAADGLATLLPQEEAKTRARTFLAPIADTVALTETLRTWLSLHGSWDRTAVALTVHRNTVRQRIARCATLLNSDLDDPDVRMELWFALRLL